MVEHTRDHGKITTCMDKAPTLGAMAENTKGNTTWTKSMVMVSITGLMEDDMKVSGVMVNSMEKANIFYQMELLK